MEVEGGADDGEDLLSVSNWNKSPPTRTVSPSFEKSDNIKPDCGELIETSTLSVSTVAISSSLCTESPTAEQITKKDSHTLMPLG